MGYICVLCGENFENTRQYPKYYRPVNIYMERGVSKNHFLWNSWIAESFPKMNSNVRRID